MSPATIDYGDGPDSDQLEITLFGPGYGEAIVVHLGLDRWMLVDSCMAPGASIPASADYLKQIGVAPSAVKALVASHWHDDHVKGMSQLVNLYQGADFFVPAVLATKDSRAFLSAYSGAQCSGLSRGTKELYDSLLACKSSIAVKSRCEILYDQAQPIPLHVVAFSPTEPAFSQFLAHILEYVPQMNTSLPIGHAPDVSPNITSVVLHIKLGQHTMLLGADLERHTTAGWDVVVSDAWCRKKSPADIFKVAHHGSHSGDHPDVWANFLSSNATALMSPFNNGKHMLPTSDDRKRILAHTNSAYITSTASKKAQLPTDQLKRLNDICSNVTPVQSGFGAIRARRRMGTQSWNVELFGSAGSLV